MKRLVLAILVVLSLAVGVNAQTFRGAINGTVTDPSGAVVPNAQVKATENSTGIDHTTVTTSDGAFAFQDIPLGFYKVTVTASGFPVYTVDKSRSPRERYTRWRSSFRCSSRPPRWKSPPQP